MIPRMFLLSAACLLSLVTLACSKRSSDPQFLIEIPPGFSGNFVLEMGIRNAPPLEKRGNAYVVPVPQNGKLVTSTLFDKPAVSFQNAGVGSVWGYSQSTFTTGDGISVGGRIEFFVGSRKEYEAEQGKKNHSGDPSFSFRSAPAGA